ncbi:MAG: anti-sigma F factor [Lachnospiraceae bacterium]|nr:anti-sigma F factor [Lachnospiraceae bacterium]
MKNEMKLEFSACSVNEGLARIAVAAFMAGMNPTLEEVEDVKTAVSEAVTNCIIHGYGMPEEETDEMQYQMPDTVADGGAAERKDGASGETEKLQYHQKEKNEVETQQGKVYIICRIHHHILDVEIRDYGVGIADIAKAMEPLYTTKPEQERSGMGFAFMEAFMDELLVESRPGEGTCVKMKKYVQSSFGKREPV